MVSVLASGTEDRGFKPGRSRRVFRAKISSALLPSEGKTSGNYVEVEFSGEISVTRGLSCRLTWSASGVDGWN